MKTTIKKYRCCICGRITPGRKPNTLKLRSSGVRWSGKHTNNGRPCDGMFMQAEVFEVEVEPKPKDKPSVTAEDVEDWT